MAGSALCSLVSPLFFVAARLQPSVLPFFFFFKDRERIALTMDVAEVHFTSS